MKAKIKPRGRIGSWFIHRYFPEAKLQETWHTFGRTIYTPGYMTNDLLEHEKTHIFQQRNKLGGLIWWYRYIHNPKFRYEQELPAYRNQIAFMVARNAVTRDQLAQMKWRVAGILSGPHYNHMISHSQAMHDLRY